MVVMMVELRDMRRVARRVVLKVEMRDVKRVV